MKGFVGYYFYYFGGVDIECVEVVVDVGVVQEVDSVCGVVLGLVEYLFFYIFVQVCVDLGLGGGYGC